MVHDPLRPHGTELAGGYDEAPVALGVLVGLAARGTDADGCNVTDESEFTAPADGAAVGVKLSLVVVAVVQVGVKMDYVQWLELAQSPHHRIGDGVVAAHDDREGAALHHLLHRLGQLVEVAMHVGRDSGDVAAVGHGNTPQQLVPGLDVVKAFRFLLAPEGVGVGIGPGSVADSVGAVARPRPSQRPLVKGHADEGHLGCQLIQAGAQGRLEEGAGLCPQNGPCFGAVGRPAAAHGLFRHRLLYLQLMVREPQLNFVRTGSFYASPGRRSCSLCPSGSLK